MKKKVDLKDLVRAKYGSIAGQSHQHNQSSCCGSTSCCDTTDYSIFSEDYSRLKGYEPGADLALGCGLPTEYAGIEPGHRVLDLGSGAGNDCFVARACTGETGWVTGLDFTDEMLEKARENNRKLAYTNVEFIKGDIEEMPLPDASYDVVISNCVLNLVPDKLKAFREIFRVLKPGGHFCISDVVLRGALPDALRESAEMYAGCVSGALQQEEYLSIISQAGFQIPQIQKEKMIQVPDSILLQYLSPSELEAFRKSEQGIFSLTLTAKK